LLHWAGTSLFFKIIVDSKVPERCHQGKELANLAAPGWCYRLWLIVSHLLLRLGC
jgi:hypothetical protein